MTFRVPFSIRPLVALTFLLLAAQTGYAQTAPASPDQNALPAATTAAPTVATPTVATPTATPVEEARPAKKRRIPPLGADVEVIYLLNSRARNSFGSTIVSLSPGIGDPTPSLKGKWGVDFSLTRTDDRVGGNENKLLMVSLGPEYRRAYIPAKYRAAIAEAMRAPGQGNAQPQNIERPRPPFMPYYGASLNAIYTKLEIPGRDIDEGKFGFGGSVFVGTTIKRRAFLEARLRAMSSVEGYNFSGAGLTFGVRF